MGDRKPGRGPKPHGRKSPASQPAIEPFRQPAIRGSAPTLDKAPIARGPKASGPLVWAFARWSKDPGHRWSLAGMDPGHAHEVIGWLADLECFTWDTACVGADARLKRIPQANLGADAKAELRRRKLDDVDELWELRKDGRTRLWGIRDYQTDVFMAFWWDPKHEVCPSKKKHT